MHVRFGPSNAIRRPAHTLPVSTPIYSRLNIVMQKPQRALAIQVNANTTHATVRTVRLLGRRIVIRFSAYMYQAHRTGEMGKKGGSSCVLIGIPPLGTGARSNPGEAVVAARAMVAAAADVGAEGEGSEENEGAGHG